jgi:hypothetical protein
MIPFNQNSVDQINPDHLSTSRKRLSWRVVIGLVLLILIGTIILIAQSSNRSHSYPQADQEKSTTFQGMSSFINDGLTTDQVNGLIQAFSKFSPKAKDISINSNSLYPGPHKPGDGSPFTINFNSTIDSTTYKGTVSYSDLSSVRLILFDESGKQAFDSGVIPVQS